MRNIILSSKNAARATPQLLMLTIVVIALATALALSPGLTGSTARAQSDTEETWSGQMTAQRQQQTAVGTASQQPGAGESSEGETETAPDAPTGLITTAVSHDSVTLSWDDPDSDGENTLSGSCMGSASFKVIWGYWTPARGSRQADQWEAHFVTERGAGTFTHQFGIENNNPGLPVIRGTVNLR